MSRRRILQPPLRRPLRHVYLPMATRRRTLALRNGFCRNIAFVEPTERALLRDALIELNRRFFPGNRLDPIPGE
jgi:hypothetical protein